MSVRRAVTWLFERLYPRERTDQEPRMHEDPERTTPLGLIRYSDEFFQAALDVDAGMGREDGFEVHAPIPVLHLAAHSIELALKAYLVHRGVTLRKVRSKFGHDINKCLRKAEQLGLLTHVEFSHGEMEAISFLSELHLTRQLEYIVTGSKVFPIFGPVSTFTDKLIHAVAPLVGYRYARNHGFVHPSE